MSTSHTVTCLLVIRIRTKYATQAATPSKSDLRVKGGLGEGVAPDVGLETKNRKRGISQSKDRRGIFKFQLGGTGMCKHPEA